MHPYNQPPSRRTPPPDGVSGRSAKTAAPPPLARTPPQPPQPSQPHSDFLIIGLFALRLTKRLIEGLDGYADRDADIAWLANFLAPYPPEFGLAKITGARKADYATRYQEIVSRMKRQPRYPMRFMQMNPDRSMQQGRDGAAREREEGMTDQERLDVIDFCDAAAEWGSTVPIPSREADRMIELADQRRIADLEEMRAPRDERRGMGGRG